MCSILIYTKIICFFIVKVYLAFFLTFVDESQLEAIAIEWEVAVLQEVPTVSSPTFSLPTLVHVQLAKSALQLGHC